MRIGEMMDTGELGRLLEQTVADEHFISMCIDRTLSGIGPLVAPGLNDAVEAFQRAVFQLGTARPSSDYVTLMGILLRKRFNGWNTEDIDLFVWRLLHEDVLNMAGEETVGDPRAARFWLAILDAITGEDVESERQHSLAVYEAGPGARQNTNLRAHAIASLASYAYQVLPVLLQNSGAPHAWTALNALSGALRWVSDNVAERLALRVGVELDEGMLLEWLCARFPDGKGVSPDVASALKMKLIGSRMDARLLEVPEGSERALLERLVAEARADVAARVRVASSY